MHLFYTPQLDNGQTGTVVFDEDESKHAIRVLRLRVGDPVQLINGKGGYFQGLIHSDDPKAVSVSLTKSEEGLGRRPYKLHLAVAPTKNIDRYEWLIEKATEIGVDEITPLICQRSERRDLKTARLTKVAVSAMKQSMKAYLPVIHEPIKFSEFIKANNALRTAQGGEERPAMGRLIAHCEPGEKFSISSVISSGADALILIGPEGDFHPDEIRMAFEGGYTPISLGHSRLRTETAGIVACTELALLNY